MSSRRGRPRRINPNLVAGPDVDSSGQVRGGRSFYRLGAKLVDEPGPAEAKRNRAEAFEFNVRKNRHWRELSISAVTPLDEDRAYNEAERLALKEIRALRRTRKPAVRAPGRPARSGDLLQRFNLLKESSPQLSTRSAARMIAAQIGEGKDATYSRLRRALRRS